MTDPTAPRPAWSGDLLLDGRSIAVHAHALLKAAPASGVRALCMCHHRPVRAPRVCAVTQAYLPPDAIRRGVELDDGTYAPAAEPPPTAAPAPEAQRGVATLWAALAATDVAILTRWRIRAGARDAAAAIHAGRDGLLLTTLAAAERHDSTSVTAAPPGPVEPAEVAALERALTAYARAANRSSSTG